MPSNSDITGSQFVWTKYILLIGLALVCLGFGYITWWSFWQTRDWFAFLDFDGNDYVSLSLSVIFQYGQGPVLFLRSLFIFQRLSLESILKRRTSNTAEYLIVKHNLEVAKWSVFGLGLLFMVFASVDAWTNVQQMHSALDAKAALGALVGKDKYFFTSIIGVVAVFVEEGLGVCFSLFSHTFNDIRQIHGYKRIGWLDVFSDHARSLISGGGTQPQRPQGGGGNRHHSGGGGNHPSHNAAQVSRPQQAIMPTAHRSEPTYHPVTVSGARHPDPGVGFARPPLNDTDEDETEDA